MKARSPKLKARTSPSSKRRQEQQDAKSSSSGGGSPRTQRPRQRPPRRFQRQQKRSNAKSTTTTTTSRIILFTLVCFWLIAMICMVSHLHNMKSNNDSATDNNNNNNNNTSTTDNKIQPVMEVHAAVHHHHQHSIHHPKQQQEHHEDHILEAIPRREHHASAQGNNDDDARVESSTHLKKYESPLLIFTCHRAEYLNETLSKVLEYIPKDCEIGCPIVISQDGTDEETTQLIRSIQQHHTSSAYSDIPILHLHHKQDKQQQQQQFAGYYALAKHYGWALEQVFSGQAYQQQQQDHDVDDFPIPLRTIILEEDLRIAPDFFYYMKATAPILDSDATLLAVSAFNDNGKHGMVLDERRILRSDFFPGLGWMMTRELWTTELSTKWPDSFWDDWLREPEQRKGRHILRPEISRTFHFGSRGGASGNQYGGHLLEIQLNQDVVVDFTQLSDLEYNLRQDVYNHDYWEMVSEQTELVVTTKNNPGGEEDVLISKAKELVKEVNVRIEYTTQHQFARYARSLHLMDDEKAGIPRTAYKGIVETRPLGNHFLFLTPKPLEKVKEELIGIVL